jgi:hypothetical protein
MKRRACSAVVAVIAALAVMSAVASGAAAASIAVTTQADTLSGEGCSLRAAIIAANNDAPVAGCPAGSGTDTITLPAGAYVLTIPPSGYDYEEDGDLNIASNMTVVGAGAGSTTIDGGGIDRVLEVNGPTVATIEGVTITGGHALDGEDGQYVAGGPTGPTVGDTGGNGGSGGGILDYGSLTLTGDVVSGNRAGDGGGGGDAGDGGVGVGTGGYLTCSGGSSTGGRGGSGGFGGGIAVAYGHLTLNSTVVSGNRAGAGGDGGNAANGGQGSNEGCVGEGGSGGAATGGPGGPGGLGGGIAMVGAGVALNGTDCSISENLAGAGGAAGTEGSGGVGASGSVKSGAGGDADGGYGGDGGGGGGILTEGEVSLTDCTMAANAAGAGGPGSAAHYGAGGTTGAEYGGRGGDAIGGNGGFGGGGGAVLFVGGGTGTIVGTTIVANSTGAGGAGGAGGVAGAGGYADGHGHSEVSGEASGGRGGAAGPGAAVLAEGTEPAVTISDSTISADHALSGGDGGAGGTSPGAAAANTADGGAGGAAGAFAIVSGTQTFTLSHDTVDASTVGTPGAGGAAGASQASHAAGAAGTPASGAGVDGPVGLATTIVAGNAVDQCHGPVVDGGGDLTFPDATCPGAVGDPELGPLADNGGPTETQALGSGSDALTAISFASGLCAGADQRGVARPPGAACDIGAFQNAAAAAVTGGVSEVTPTAATVAGSVTPNGPAATVVFEYGSSTSYGSRSAPRTLGAGVAPVAVSAGLSGLVPDTTYHYRVVGAGLDGTSAGADATFRTAAAAAAGSQSRGSGSPFGGLKIVGQAVKLTAKGVAPIKASCPAGTAGGCTGTLTLTAKIKTVKRLTVHGKPKLVRKTKTTHLGSVRFDVHPGAVATLEVKLSRAALPRVGDAGKLKATATAVATDGSGDAATTHAALALERYARPDKSKSRRA